MCPNTSETKVERYVMDRQALCVCTGIRTNEGQMNGVHVACQQVLHIEHAVAIALSPNCERHALESVPLCSEGLMATPLV